MSVVFVASGFGEAVTEEEFSIFIGCQSGTVPWEKTSVNFSRREIFLIVCFFLFLFFFIDLWRTLVNFASCVRGERS